MRRGELLALLTLGPGFPFRLSATVAASWADDASRAAVQARGRPALVAALTGRLAPAVQQWLGIDPGQVEATLPSALREDHGWGSLELTGTGSGAVLRAALPAGWLACVWAAGVVVLTDGLTPWPDDPPRGMRVVVALLGDNAPDAPSWARSVRVPSD